MKAVQSTFRRPTQSTTNNNLILHIDCLIYKNSTDNKHEAQVKRDAKYHKAYWQTKKLATCTAVAAARGTIAAKR